MSVEWVEYKGKRILRVDLRGLREEQVVETIELEVKMIAESPTKVLVLGNVEGASISTLARIKQLGREAISPKILKSAIVGVTDLKGFLLRSYNRFTGGSARPFNTESEAMEWLVE